MEDLSARLSELLGNSDNIEQLRAIASALGLGKSDDPPAAGAASQPNSSSGGMPDIGALIGALGTKSASSDAPPGGIDPGMLGKLLGVLGALNTTDRNTDLLRALEPFCDDHRKKRVEEAAQIMRILKLLPLLDSGEKED